MRRIALALALFAAIITDASARQNNNPAAAFDRTRYTLALSLKLRGDVLNGAMIAQSLPSSRVGLALTHWVELRKE